MTVLSAGFHEFGHAAAARYGGSTPGRHGLRDLPVLAGLLHRRHRQLPARPRRGGCAPTWAGCTSTRSSCWPSFVVWWLTGWHAVLLLVATQVLQMIRQLAPLLRFDGYHVLADLTGVPDLYQRIGPVLSGLLPGRWRGRRRPR